MRSNRIITNQTYGYFRRKILNELDEPNESNETKNQHHQHQNQI